MSLPSVPPLDLIKERLPLIFPDGTENRNYVVRDMAVKTIYVMFYAGAIHGLGRWIRPSQVTDMTDEQAIMLSDGDRLSWVARTLSSQKDRPLNTWYAANSREPIRDETLRTGLIPSQAAIERSDLPTTSSKPRYALNADFSKLFDPLLEGEAALNAFEDWRNRHLSKAALSRQRLIKEGVAAYGSGVDVTFPNGERRRLAPGLSSVISKAVIEVFAPSFLKNPALLWLSESGNKVVARDEGLAARLGLKIDPSKALPDIILVDLGVDPAGSDFLVIFCEVVATDGPIDRNRKEALSAVARDAGFDQAHLAFLTAFMDRSSQAFRKASLTLAWGSFAWLLAEPDKIVHMRDFSKSFLSGLVVN
ncbi:MAG: restriction endonuclease [Alcanivoracaceae bacterium]|nr:restriction endonuclease [Alcanivoracaceae bacterium]